MSLPRRSHMLGPVAYAETGHALFLCICGLRAPGKEHGEIDLHHIGCSVASHAESSAVQLQGASATSPSRGAAGPACLFRTGRQCAVFRFFRLCGRIPQSLPLALACSLCDNRHSRWRLSMLLCSYRAVRSSQKHGFFCWVLSRYFRDSGTLSALPFAR